MKRDVGVPELEIELQSIASAPGRSSAPDAPTPAPPPARRRQLFTIVSGIAATVIVLVALSLVSSDDTEREGAIPPSSTAAPITTPTTIRTPVPNILGAGTTNLLLWTFDETFHLQTLDLDSGDLHPLGVRGGFALFPLFGNVVMFDGDKGSSIVSALGATSAEGLGPGAYPIVERDGRKLWALSEEAPRRWERRALDGTILDVLPFDTSVGVLPYNDHAVLLRTREGTSLFDLVTRQQQLLTPAHASSAGGNVILSRSCTERLCNLTVIDIETRVERPLLSNVPDDDSVRTALSPDGAYLAITRQEPGTNRTTEIVAVSNGTTVWNSPIGAYGPSAWSWSPDSKWFFDAMSGRRILAVGMHDPSTEIEIPLSFTPMHGLAVTYR